MNALLVVALLVIPFGVDMAPFQNPDIGPAVSKVLSPENRWSLLPSTPPEMSPPFSTNVRISDDLGTGSQNEVSMVVDTEGRMVAAWNDARGGSDVRCGRSHSLDRGQTWSPNVLYGNPTYDASVDPVLAADDAGNVYHICMSLNRPFGTGSTMEVLRTSDGGVTWSAPVDIGMTTGDDDKPWIAAHGNGTVFAGWSHYHSGTSQVVFRTSIDWGQNWSTPQYIGAAASAYLGMEVDDSGFVHTVFYENGNIVYRRSEDLGASFTSQVVISPAGDGCDACIPRSGTLPALAASGDGKDLYVVWSGNFSAPTGEDIRLARSHNGGSSWNAVTVNDDATPLARQFMPYVDVDWEGRVHVMWSDLRSGNHEVYYTNSTDGGITFGSSLPVTDTDASTVSFQGDYQVILVDSFGVAHIAWCDTRNGHGDIYYATAQVASESIAIVVSPSSSQITADETQQFTAAGYGPSGGQISISPTWEATGGTIDASGLYVPSKAGNFTVYANYSSASGSATVEVRPGALNAIAVDPPSLTLSADDTQQFTAIGQDAKGNQVAISPAWEATGGSIDATGLYTPSLAGAFLVFANESGISGFASVTVTPGRLASIVVDPVAVTITADQTVLFAALGYDAQANEVDISPTWETTGGSVDPNGIYTPSPAGTFAVYANQSGVSGLAVITVTPGALASIAVTPSAATITADETLQLSAAGYDAHGNPVSVSVVWSVTNGSLSDTGLFSPWSAGQWTVTAQQGSLEARAAVTVLPGEAARLEITPSSVSLRVGDSVTFVVRAWDAKGNAIENPEVEWSLEGGMGAIDETGKLVVDQAGSGTVSVSVGDVSVSADVEVVALSPVAPLQDILVYLIGGGVLGLIIVILLLRRRGRRRGEEE